MEASTGPQMPANGVLSRLRSFEDYCSFWEAYRSSLMLVIFNDSGSHWGTGSLSILHRVANSVEACGGFHSSPNIPKRSSKPVNDHLKITAAFGKPTEAFKCW